MEHCVVLFVMQFEQGREALEHLAQVGVLRRKECGKEYGADYTEVYTKEINPCPTHSMTLIARSVERIFAQFAKTINVQSVVKLMLGTIR